MTAVKLIRDKYLEKTADPGAPLLFTPPGTATADMAYPDPFGTLIQKRSTLRNNGMPFRVTMQPVLFSYKDGECRLKDDFGKTLASMRTTSTGYSDLARLLAVPLAVAAVNTIGASILDRHFIDNVVKKAKLDKLVSKQAPEENNEFLRKLAKYNKILLMIASLALGTGFMVNFAIYLHKPVYEFRNAANEVQLNARHQGTNIRIEYTKRRHEAPVHDSFLMTMNMETKEWNLHSAKKQGTEGHIVLKIPTEWKDNTKFTTLDRKLFEFNVASLSRYSLTLGKTRIVVPLQSGSEQYQMQFNGNCGVPRDVIAFSCFVARTVETMPLDFVLYMAALVAISGFLLKPSMEALSNAQKTQDVAILAEYVAMAKNLWEEGAIDNLEQLQNYEKTKKEIRQAALRLAHRIGRDAAADTTEQKEFYNSSALYDSLYKNALNIDTNLKKLLEACGGDEDCEKNLYAKETRELQLKRMKSLGKFLQWSNEEKDKLNVVAKKNKELHLVKINKNLPQLTFNSN